MTSDPIDYIMSGKISDMMTAIEYLKGKGFNTKRSERVFRKLSRMEATLKNEGRSFTDRELITYWRLHRVAFMRVFRQICSTL